MADTEELLAQLLAQNAPQAMSLEQQQLKRKRDMAMAQLQAVQNQPQRAFRRNPLAFALDGLIGLDAKQQLQSYDAQETQSAARSAQSRNQEMAQLMAGFSPRMEAAQGPLRPGEELPPIQQPADPRAALAKAMTSAHPDVRSLASTLQKQRMDTFKNVLDATKDRAAPESVVVASGQLDPGALQFRNPGAPELKQFTPQGATAPVTYAVTENKDGSKDLKFAPAGNSVNVNTADHASKPVLSKMGERYSPGGEQALAGNKLRTDLTNTQELLHTLAKDPQMGAGATGFQVLRKWAQTFGAPVNEKTTPTEIAAMQLGQKTLDRLGGLGAQVSNTDRDFMLSVQGSLGSDPAAVRKLLLLEAKYMMQAISNHNENVDMVDKAFEGKLQFPRVRFSFKVPTPFLQEMQEIWDSPTDPAPPRQPSTAPARLPGRITRAQ